MIVNEAIETLELPVATKAKHKEVDEIQRSILTI